jgi:hypothetical protein
MLGHHISKPEHFLPKALSPVEELTEGPDLHISHFGGLSQNETLGKVFRVNESSRVVGQEPPWNSHLGIVCVLP